MNLGEDSPLEDNKGDFEETDMKTKIQTWRKWKWKGGIIMSMKTEQIMSGCNKLAAQQKQTKEHWKTRGKTKMNSALQWQSYIDHV